MCSLVKQRRELFHWANEKFLWSPCCQKTEIGFFIFASHTHFKGGVIWQSEAAILFNYLSNVGRRKKKKIQGWLYNRWTKTTRKRKVMKEKSRPTTARNPCRVHEFVSGANRKRYHWECLSGSRSGGPFLREPLSYTQICMFFLVLRCAGFIMTNTPTVCTKDRGQKS